MQQADIAQEDAPEQVPGLVVVLRAAIRPLVTLALTGTFILLLLKGVYSDGETRKGLQDMMTVLLAVYGPIVGFWFGQQAALKQK